MVTALMKVDKPAFVPAPALLTAPPEKKPAVPLKRVKEVNYMGLRPTFSDFALIEKDPKSVFPFKFSVLPGNYSDYITKVVRPRGFTKTQCNEDDDLAYLSFMWKPTQFTSKFYCRVDQINMTREAKYHIVINHLENVKGITTKTGLIKSLRKYYKNAPDPATFHYTIHDSTPTSFIVVSNSQDADYQAFVQRFKELEKDYFAREKIPAKHCGGNVWLIKPAAMNQGRGIEIFKNDLGAMKKFLETRPAFTYWVVQKYIERPLLYKDRKFDIRVWALITWKGELYYYKPGYLRTSSETYTLDSEYNYVHLTNNCLQKYGTKYGAYEEGNTISFETFQNYLSETYPHLGVDLEKHILPRMKDLIIDCFLSVKDELNPSKRKNCFELLGFDFLIDEDFRTWLIEVNTNPYLGIPNKFIEGVLPKMLNDLFEITLDPVLRPVNPMPKRDIKNQFELLYCERRKVNQRRSFAADFYPIPSLTPTPNIIAPLMTTTMKKILKESNEGTTAKTVPIQKKKPREERVTTVKINVLSKQGEKAKPQPKKKEASFSYTRKASVDPQKHYRRK